MADESTLENMSEEEETESEILIYMNFEEFTKTSFVNSDKIFKLIGLETDKPVLQLGNRIYQGEYTQTLGTNVFFEQDLDPKPTIKPVSKNAPNAYYKYSAKTEKTLHMKRIIVRQTNSDKAAQEQVYKLPDTYEAALQDLVKLVENEKIVDQVNSTIND